MKEYKECSMCNVNLLLNKENFATRNDRKELTYQSNCRNCQKDYRKKHYEKNKNKYKKKAVEWRKQEKMRILKYLETKSCVDCGNNNPVVFEFDHIKGKKEFNIGEKIGHLSRERLQKEIDKCEIVCANCHKIRTAKRGKFYRFSNASIA